MSVFEKLEERATGMCRPDEFERKPVSIEFECVETGDTRPSTYTRQFEHELRLRLFARFWCNKAQFVDERQHAERVLANLLYRDVLEALDGIAHAVSDGDRRAALNRCAELRSSLTR